MDDAKKYSEMLEDSYRRAMYILNKMILQPKKYTSNEVKNNHIKYPLYNFNSGPNLSFKQQSYHPLYVSTYVLFTLIGYQYNGVNSPLIMIMNIMEKYRRIKNKETSICESLGLNAEYVEYDEQLFFNMSEIVEIGIHQNIMFNLCNNNVLNDLKSDTKIIIDNSDINIKKIKSNIDLLKQNYYETFGKEYSKEIFTNYLNDYAKTKYSNEYINSIIELI